MNTLSPLNTGAVTSGIGLRLAGFVLGVPFFATALLSIATGHLPNRGHSPATDAFARAAELYILLVVLPCANILSAAISAFVAPESQERRFAAGAFFYHVQMLLILVVIGGAFVAYAGIGPFWERSLGNLNIPNLLLTMGASLLASAVASTGGCALGMSARIPNGTTTRLLQKLSKGIE